MLGARSLAFLAMAVLGLGSCGGSQPKHRPLPKPRPTLSVQAASARCARLAALGFDPCPPPPSQIQLPKASIRNATDGAISNATAQEWGRAFLRGQAYYYWAIQHDDEQTLRSGVFALSDPTTVGNLFGGDLQELDEVRQSGGTIIYQPPQTPIVQVVVIPSSLQAAMTRQGLHPANYGMAVEFKGPERRAVRLHNGSIETIFSVGPQYVDDFLVWGVVKVDPSLGSIWYEYGIYECNGPVKLACGL
jgi:hypothetical protein